MKYPAARRTFIRRALKAIFIIMLALAALVIVTLKLVERQPAQLKVGFESFLTQRLGYPAEIGEVADAQFFPTVHLHFKDVRLWPLDNPKGRVLSAGAVDIRLPFWSLFWPSRQFDRLQIEDVRIDAALTGFADVEISQVSLNPQTQTLDAQGAIDGLSFTVSAPVEMEGEQGFSWPRPPVRISATIEGGQTKGSFFIDINGRGNYGAVATFARYRPADVAPLRAFLEQRLAGAAEGALPVQLHIEKLAGVRGGPFIFEPVRLENGALQPPACLAKHQGGAPIGNHPCARYRAQNAQEDE